MNLNEYFSNRKLFKDSIIVISAKDDCSGKLRRFTAKSILGLEMSVGFRNSYVAVVDLKRGFVYEHATKERYECSYQVGDRFIDIITAGRDCGDCSSIVVGSNEFSHNKRGLNIALFNYKTLVLQDSFFVDTCSDDALLIRR